MNAQTKIQASLPDLLRNAREAAPLRSFTGWRLGEEGRFALEIKLPFATLAEVEQYFGQEAFFGCTFFVVEHDAVTDTKMLHVYRVRKGKWAGHFSDAYTKVYPHTADKLFAMPVNAFDPAQPWLWSPSDPIGNGPVIDVRVQS